MQEHPELGRAIREGRRICDAKVMQALYERAIGGVYETTEVLREEGKPLRVKQVRRHIPPDTAAILFYLRNRMPERWKSKPVRRAADHRARSSDCRLA